MCSKVLQPASLVVVFETLLSSAATTVDEEKGNPSWQALADFYVICILSCLPWGGAELMEVRPSLALYKCYLLLGWYHCQLSWLLILLMHMFIRLPVFSICWKYFYHVLTWKHGTF